jgi:ParB/RepB/Spo0J family partition protein
MIKRTGRNMKRKNVSRDTIKKIRVDQISPNPNQARIDFDKAGLVDLAESIKATGLLQPIIVKPVGNRFQIIAGERRWRAHQLSGFSKIDAIIRDSDNSVVESLIENIQREDLSVFEEAAAFKKLLDTKITQKELSRQVGKSRTYIAQKVRLLELGTDVRNAMESKEVGESLHEGAARQLLRLKPIDDLATTQLENSRWSHLYARFIISKPNYSRTVADVRFGVDENLAFLYRCNRDSEDELERKADIAVAKFEKGEKLSAFRWGAPLMWSLVRPDFGKLTKNQDLKLREAFIRYNWEYLKRYPCKPG